MASYKLDENDIFYVKQEVKFINPINIPFEKYIATQ